MSVPDNTESVENLQSQIFEEKKGKKKYIFKSELVNEIIKNNFTGVLLDEEDSEKLKDLLFKYSEW